MEDFVKILHPFAPFITEELWEMLGNKPSVLFEKWPAFDESKTIDDTVTVVFSVNGKVRAKVDLQKGLSKDELIELALSNDRITSYTDGKTIIKKIAVPDKLVNIVIK